MRPLPILPLIVACSGVVAERPKVLTDQPRLTPAAAAAMADSASICWQRFHRGIPVEANCTSLGVAVRIDTVRDTLRIPPAQGIPFGPVDLFVSWTQPGAAFSGTLDYANPRGIIAKLGAMRANKIRGFLKLTGESHNSVGGNDAYRTNGKFDLAKWEAALKQYDTPEIKAAITAAVADGTLLGYSMIDEPNHPTWGGVFTKALLDEMARYSKSLFPTLPVAVPGPHYWRASEKYQVVDVMIPQTWRPAPGASPFAWRDSLVAAARFNGTALAPSLNLMGNALALDCTPIAIGSTRCYMPAQQVKDWGTVLASEPYVCALFMWKYRQELFARPEYKSAFEYVAQIAKQRPAKSCRRTSPTTP